MAAKPTASALLKASIEREVLPVLYEQEFWARPQDTHFGAWHSVFYQWILYRRLTPETLARVRVIVGTPQYLSVCVECHEITVQPARGDHEAADAFEASPEALQSADLRLCDIQLSPYAWVDDLRAAPMRLFSALERTSRLFNLTFPIFLLLYGIWFLALTPLAIWAARKNTAWQNSDGLSSGIEQDRVAKTVADHVRNLDEILADWCA